MLSNIGMQAVKNTKHDTDLREEQSIYEFIQILYLERFETSNISKNSVVWSWR